MMILIEKFDNEVETTLFSSFQDARDHLCMTHYSEEEGFDEFASSPEGGILEFGDDYIALRPIAFS